MGGFSFGKEDKGLCLSLSPNSYPIDRLPFLRDIRIDACHRFPHLRRNPQETSGAEPIRQSFSGRSWLPFGHRVVIGRKRKQGKPQKLTEREGFEPPVPQGHS